MVLKKVEVWLEKCRKYLKMWVERIVAEKKRQMQNTDPHMWPPCISWRVETVFDMPIVLMVIIPVM